MEIFLLGAGKPARGQNPTALKNIALNTRVMDWQLHSFESIAVKNSIHYLGGYHIEDVIKHYPELNFTVNPNWESQGVLNTFLKSPLSGCPAIVSYSDTIFRKEVISDIVSIDADVVFGIDSTWKQRYKNRSSEDLNAAETLYINRQKNALEVEFTGLIYFNSKAIKHLLAQKNLGTGSNMIDLIAHLKEGGFNVKSFDVSGNWAEFNSPHDIAKFILGTKAETLARLESRVKKSIIGKQVSFTVKDWLKNPELIINRIKQNFKKTQLIIRSSSKGEDNWFSSNAGGYESLLNINSEDKTELKVAVDSVIRSYGKGKNQGENQVLVQGVLSGVKASGVVFTCGLETGSPYYRFNFDDTTNSTETVTAGLDSSLRTIFLSKFKTKYLNKIEPSMVKVLVAIKELEHLLGYDKLDIEFAIDSNDQVHIFQVRPITVDHSNFEVDLTLIDKALDDSRCLFESQQPPSPFILGDKTLFANMSDWNPAEIIGTRPKPLAFSLYRHVITNDIWSKQRAEYGYRDIQPCALIHSFCGQPYVDVRASINSFIPETIPDQSAKRLANAYIDVLSNNPQFHDKIEFDVLFTIWTPKMKQKAINRLAPHGVTNKDILALESGLKEITCKALTRLDKDTSSIDLLKNRRKQFLESKIPDIDKVIALIADCKTYGTLAFSHAARAGFVATTILNSLVESGAVSNQRRLAFLNSFNTVTGDFENDKYAHSQKELSDKMLVENYGHLRPGTYEITSQAYWENPSCYLKTSGVNQTIKGSVFVFNDNEKQSFSTFLSELGSSLQTKQLQSYLISAIQAREFVKFEFTKNLSCALDLCVKLGKNLGINRESLSFLEYNDLLQLKLNALNISQLEKLIAVRKKQHITTLCVELPSLIQTQTDFYAFEPFDSLPNFVTTNRIEAQVQELTSKDKTDLKNKIVMIQQADPGYDWLFSHNIAGLITQYGGANSHMAIRAAEINLPAAIGVGEKLYEKISYMKMAEMDCANQVIREIF